MRAFGMAAIASALLVAVAVGLYYALTEPNPARAQWNREQLGAAHYFTARDAG